ncbi:hypothetical protein FRB90_005379, partial [Tulasnella sp. 427]
MIVPAGSDVLLRHRRRCHPDSVEKDAVAAAAAAAVASSSKDSPTTGKGAGKGRPRKGSGKARHDRRASINTASTPDDHSGDDSPGRDSLPTPQEPPLASPVDLGLPLPASATLGTMGASSLGGGTIPPPPEGMPGISPTLMPLFMPLSTTPPTADTMNQNNVTPPLLDATASIFAALSAPNVTSNPNPFGGGFSPNIFNLAAVDPIASDPSLSGLWGSFQTTSSPPPLTDAELFAYLSGEASGNELGLDIFQPERSLITAEMVTLKPVLKKRFQAIDPSDRF